LFTCHPCKQVLVRRLKHASPRGKLVLARGKASFAKL
jgi:hypothetical protein